MSAEIKRLPVPPGARLPHAQAAEAPKPKRANGRRHIDWDAIEQEYRVNQRSVRDIAKRHGVSHTRINQRVAAEGWQRDLSAAVKHQARMKLLETAVPPLPATEELAILSGVERDAHIVEAAAERQAAIQSGHREDIDSVKGLLRDLVADYRAMRNGEIDPASLLGKHESRADLLVKIARVMERYITLERESWNIGDDADDLGKSFLPNIPARGIPGVD